MSSSNAAVTRVAADGHDQLDPALLADLRARYDTAVEWGRLTNRCPRAVAVAGLCRGTVVVGVRALAFGAHISKRIDVVAIAVVN